MGEIRDREDDGTRGAFAETATCAWPRCMPTAPTRRWTASSNFFPEERRQQLLMDLSLN